MCAAKLGSSVWLFLILDVEQEAVQVLVPLSFRLDICNDFGTFVVSRNNLPAVQVFVV